MSATSGITRSSGRAAAALLAYCALVGVLSSRVISAAEGPSFTDAVQPILMAKCVSCHGLEKQEGGLRLDSPAAAKAGGDRGASLVPVMWRRAFWSRR